MAKTEKTLELEQKIFSATSKMGVFGCFEVTIGFNQRGERVDYMTYDTKGIWRCYEIKVSKADFYSPAKKTFVGHYNYFVLTKELYELVKQDIPNHIGVYCGDWCVKKAKRQELTVSVEVLKDSLIRSLSRENEKEIKAQNTEFVERLKKEFDRMRNDNKELNHKLSRYNMVIWEISEKYGLDRKELRAFVKEHV